MVIRQQQHCLALPLLLATLATLVPVAIAATGVVITNKPGGGGNTIYVERDRSTSLTCQPVQSESPLTIYWYRPKDTETAVVNTDMTKQVYIQWDPNDRRLLRIFVNNFKEDDQGFYFCRYMNQLVNPPIIVSSDSINVLLRQRIELEKGPGEQWIPNYKTSIIYCSFRGSDITVSWFFNSQPLRTGGRYLINPRIGLTINPVQSSDEGSYVCQARSSSSSDFMDIGIKVRVYQKPVITYGPVIKYPAACINGIDCYLKCLATGSPTPQVVWYRKNDPSKPLHEYTTSKYFVNLRANVGELRIAMPEFLKDDDTYICRAIITSDVITEITTDMYVEKPIDIVIHVVPYFRNYQIPGPMNQEVKPGHTVELICEVYATNPLDLQFQKYGTYAPYTMGVQKDDNRISVRREQDSVDGRVHRLFLRIERTVYLDSWNYSCMAVNPAWNSTMNGTVSVIMPPDLSLNSNTTRQFGWIRNVTNITCISFGMPHPVWRWYREFAEIPPHTDNGTYRIITWDYEIYSQTWLQVYPNYGDDRWIFDRYICNASNRMGTGQHDIRFYQAFPPGPPIVTVKDSTASSVQLEVKPPDSDGGMHLWYYELTYRATTGQVGWYGPVQFPLNSDIRLHGLMPSTDYRIEVRARNAVGVTDQNLLPTVQIRTKDQTVPDPVIVISANRSIYPYSQTLRWRVPTNGGNPLIGYEIRVRPVFYDPATKTVTGAKGKWVVYRPPFYNPYVSDYRVTDLDANTYYEAEIKALSRVGTSDPQRSVFLTAAPDPLGRPDRVMSGAPPVGSLVWLPGMQLACLACLYACLHLSVGGADGGA